MEHIFPPKTIALVANTAVTISWLASDIARQFPESIIKKSVAIRFSCSTTAGNAVYCGVRYSTLTKDYQVAERKTLFVIPPNGSTEVTPSSKPALGLLNTDIVSISLDLTAPVTGNVTVSLIIDDDPPPLSSDPGELIGLDAQLTQDYIMRVEQGAFNALGSATIATYTVPAGKRFFLDTVYINAGPTPSFPGDLVVTLNIIYLVLGTFPYILYSESERWNTMILGPFDTPIPTGSTIRIDVVNNNPANPYIANGNFSGREVF